MTPFLHVLHGAEHGAAGDLLSGDLVDDRGGHVVAASQLCCPVEGPDGVQDHTWSKKWREWDVEELGLRTPQ